ncbi:patatin-like phospholipase family protein [Roseospirillum parvum]|uniref:Patatin-like phospholipase n=1 Tax=Roseospirillum parvum TaxID=83401 RepID=A0A1G8E1U6_9PROT|nr:patatin-like phospholipase family protein [Roseospirillum parvum]SDH63730.1 Patatin-like phospholipase [Roseospirillum parvum]
MSEHNAAPRAAEPGTFELGLAMAGAVSAGAYSAGVVDFLIEALNAWEAEKEAQRQTGKPPHKWTVPSHQVRLKALSGTSAGGICAAILSSALRQPWQPQPRPPANPEDANPLYRAWVSGIDIRQLLNTDDLTEGAAPESLLDCTVLDRLTAQALDIPGGGPKPAWLADPLEVFITTTSLAGVPYSLAFEDGQRDLMWRHADHLAFTLGDTPAGPGVHRLDPSRDGAAESWGLLGQAALATSAFPLGLKARSVVRQRAEFEALEWPFPGGDEAHPDACCHPGHLATRLTQDDFAASHVDGGVVNNEPFELVRRALAGSPCARNPRRATEAHRAVVLVDPFPNDRVEAPFNDTRLTRVPGRLLTAWKQQARFKPDELALAAAGDTYSRFMIAPVRWDHGQRHTGDMALACGSLGGFGGFLAESFRRHDYFLGRYNCQRFLQRHLVLDHRNPLFDGWEPGLKSSLGRGPGNQFLPVVPLLGTLAAEAWREETWPALSTAELEALKAPLKRRADAVTKALIAESGLGWWGRQAVGLGWRLLARGKVLDQIGATVKDDLRRRHLLRG